MCSCSIISTTAKYRAQHQISTSSIYVSHQMAAFEDLRALWMPHSSLSLKCTDPIANSVVFCAKILGFVMFKLNDDYSILFSYLIDIFI